MKFIAPKKELVRILSRAGSAADRKSSVVLHQLVLLTADVGVVSAYATDLAVSSRDTCQAEIEAPGMIAAHAGDLLDRVKAMPDGPVMLEAANGSTTLRVASQSSKLRYQLVTTPGSDYPGVERGENGVELLIQGSVLSSLMGKVKPTVGVDESRPNLNGMSIELEPGVVRAIATDGHRVTKAEVHVQHDHTTKALVPLKAAIDLRRLAEEAGDVEVKVRISERSISLTFQEAAFEARLLDATFPSWRQVIPQPVELNRCTVDSKAFERAIRAVALASDQKSGGVRFRMSKDVIEVMAESPQSGDGRDELPCSYDGPGITVGMNAKYALDALAVSGDGDWSLWHGASELEPLVWSPTINAMGSDLMGVIMPMRI